MSKQARKRLKVEQYAKLLFAGPRLVFPTARRDEKWVIRWQDNAKRFYLFVYEGEHYDADAALLTIEELDRLIEDLLSIRAAVLEPPMDDE